MPTDLFVAASGWPSSALADVVPPACRRDVEAAPAPRRDGDDAVVELPVWRPRRAARHLVPAFSALHPVPASFRFEVSLERAGRWSAWVAGATIGEARFAPLGGRTDGLAAEVDEFVAEAPAHAVRVRLRLRVDDRHAPLAAPWLVSLSAWDGSLPEPDTAPRGGAVRLAVPALSQMDADEAIRMRICSPASVAMVLAYWSVRVEVASLARDIFHPGLDRYGVWPAAIRAAGRYGVAGYLLRFPDWPSAAWCLTQGLPVIASVRYGAGELAGAAIPETTGHLLVLTGYEGDAVLVNDPAAATASRVAIGSTSSAASGSSAPAWATCSSGRPRPPAAPLHGHEDIVAGVSPGPGRTQVAVQCGGNAQRGDPDRSGTGGSARGLLERR